MDAEPGRARRIVRGAFRALDLTRRIVWNGVFLLVVLLLLAALLGGGTKVPKDAVLVLDPQGDLVEQLTGGPAERARARLAGSEARETLLKDMLDALRRAKDDKRIKVLLIDTDGLGGASLTKLQDLRAAIEDFRKSGKKVVAAGDGFDQTQYYLASCADEIHMHDQGILLLEGYGRFATFYKDGIDKLEVDWNVFRVGEYKSAVEPFLRNDMSRGGQGGEPGHLDDLWASWLQDVAPARKRKPEDLQGGIDNIVALLREASGQAAVVAQKAGLVDRIGGREAVEKRLVELTREEKDSRSYPRIGFREYLKTGPADRSGAGGRGDAVAVVVAKGPILDGTQPPGRIGGDSTAALVRKARLDKKVKAVVLRVDSGEAARSRRRSSARSWPARARPASRSWCRWEAWRRPAAIGSRPPPTRSGPARIRSPAPSASSACSPRSRSRWRSTWASTWTAWAPPGSRARCVPTAR